MVRPESRVPSATFSVAIGLVVMVVFSTLAAAQQGGESVEKVAPRDVAQAPGLLAGMKRYHPANRMAFPVDIESAMKISPELFNPHEFENMKRRLRMTVSEDLLPSEEAIANLTFYGIKKGAAGQKYDGFYTHFEAKGYHVLVAYSRWVGILTLRFELPPEKHLAIGKSGLPNFNQCLALLHRLLRLPEQVTVDSSRMDAKMHQFGDERVCLANISSREIKIGDPLELGKRRKWYENFHLILTDSNPQYLVAHCSIGPSPKYMRQPVMFRTPDLTNSSNQRPASK